MNGWCKGGNAIANRLGERRLLMWSSSALLAKPVVKKLWQSSECCVLGACFPRFKCDEVTYFVRSRWTLTALYSLFSKTISCNTVISKDWQINLSYIKIYFKTEKYINLHTCIRKRMHCSLCLAILSAICIELKLWLH